MLQLQIQEYNYQLQLNELEQQQVFALRHDMKTTINVLAGYVNNEDITKARELLNEVNYKISDQQNISYTGIACIDSVINHRAVFARENNIKINYMANIEGDIYVDPEKLTYILGNLLDNAIEAIQLFPQPMSLQSTIDLNIVLKMNILSIEIKNCYYCSPKLDKKGDYLSIKTDPKRHGFGMKAIKRILKELNGEITIEDHNDVFWVSLYILNKNWRNKNE